jgi:hypothetical protein
MWGNIVLHKIMYILHYQISYIVQYQIISDNCNLTTAYRYVVTHYVKYF